MNGKEAQPGGTQSAVALKIESDIASLPKNDQEAEQYIETIFARIDPQSLKAQIDQAQSPREKLDRSLEALDKIWEVRRTVKLICVYENRFSREIGMAADGTCEIFDADTRSIEEKIEEILSDSSISDEERSSYRARISELKQKHSITVATK